MGEDPADTMKTVKRREAMPKEPRSTSEEI